MSKIQEIIIEPTKATVGSNFKLKIKVIRYLKYNEIKEITASKLKNFTVNQLKGGN